MKHLGMLLLVVSALAGCGGKKPGANDKSIAELTGFADSMCKCADPACVQKVTDEMTKAAEADKRPLADRQLDPEQQKKFDAAAKRVTECAMKANGLTK